jgi:hypothetical protein
LIDIHKVLFLRRQPEILEHDKISKVSVNAGFNNSDLYNAMIYPFTRMVITGAIWYQGNIKKKKKKTAS